MNDLTRVLAARAPDLPDIPLFGSVTVGQVFVAVAAVVVPATVVGHVLVLWAWARGWEPRRLRNLALVVVAAAALAGPIVGMLPWWGLELTASAVRQAWDGHYLPAGSTSAAATAPLVAITSWGVVAPLHQADAVRCRPGRRGTATSAASYTSAPVRRPAAPAASAPHWPATAVTAHPRSSSAHVMTPSAPNRTYSPTPCVDARRAVVTGPDARDRPPHCLPGRDGAGKTTMLVRCSASWAEITWTAYNQQQHGARGITAVGDLPGRERRPDADTDAHEWADAMEDLGLHPDRIGVFPVRDPLNMWRMPATQLRAALHNSRKPITASTTSCNAAYST
ncbi:hypothetical protein [Pseudonocardia sp. ICBG601]|uniref:hypothetical protein n=1 Tax=Pseudonocardia sp. ICBG601 TaxID=2846759 RepID=UPI001CF6D567|nr:hypothetical protein [Pseudonocardia sp. ICBG601]